MDAIANRRTREALRGAEVLAFDLIFEVLTSQQLAELLTASLEHAAAKGKRELAQRLVGAGAKVGNALHEAIRGGHGDIASDLVESGASLAAKDGDGFPPLHVAALWGETEVAQLLMLKGADKDAFDEGNWTPLSLAVGGGNLATTMVLLTAGADVSIRCGPLNTILTHEAAYKMGNVEILRAVIEHGADVNAVDTHQDTPLHCASYNRHNRHEALLCLLEHGATVNTQTADLETPLMQAAIEAGRQGAAEVVDSLLRAGADETIVDHHGRKAFDMIGWDVEEHDRLAEDFERVRQLLANAPADRAWRRRGYLVLCRAHPDRVQGQVIGSTHHADTGRRNRNFEEMARVGKVVGGNIVDEKDGGGWTVVISKVLRLEEEGIFRTIVGYL